MTSFLTPFSSSSFNVALPSISKEFGLDAIMMSWASLSYLLASAMMLVPFGRLADIHGRKKIFLFGTFAFTVASLLLGLYPSANLIIWLRALQGIASAMIFGTGIAILVSVTPPQEKGATLGINAAAVYVGLSIGPFLGGMLTENFGWRSIFFVSSFIGVTSASLMFLKLKGEWKEAAGEVFDLWGSIVYSLMLLSLMYGFSLLPSIESLIPIVLGLCCVGVFLLIESKAKHPIIDIKLIVENRAFTFGNLAALINFSSTYAVTFLISFYLQYLKGLSPQMAGTVLIASPVVQAIFAPIAGKLSDRVEPRKISAAGMAVTSLGLATFTLIDGGTTIFIIIVSLSLLGFGLALFSSPNTNTVMSSVERKLYGIASSTLGTMRLLGQMFSQGITMIIFAICIGRLEIQPEVYSQLLYSIKIAFTVFLVFSLVGIVVSLADGNKRKYGGIDSVTRS
jgi:EmrB/QacA subfamily drug resistance transporter